MLGYTIAVELAVGLSVGTTDADGTGDSATEGAVLGVGLGAIVATALGAGEEEPTGVLGMGTAQAVMNKRRMSAILVVSFALIFAITVCSLQ